MSVEGNSSVAITAPNTVDDSESVNTAQQWKLTHRKWTLAVRNYVSTDLFRYVQFVNRDKDIEFGSGIQKIVCNACNIPVSFQLKYWVNHGSDEVMEVLRRKRQTVTTSFKSRFISEYSEVVRENQFQIALT